MAHIQSGRKVRPWPTWHRVTPPLKSVSAAKTHQALATSRSPRTVITSEVGLIIGNRRLRQCSSLRVRHAT